MANTQNLDLVKPLGTDYALVSVLNSNSDKIDAYAGTVNASLDGLRDGLGILANGNTHAAITSGQYVYVKNHGSLPEGLYKATANIAANGTLSTSNLAADSAGGLNSLNEQIGTLLIVEEYTAQYTINANATSAITANDFSLTNKAGYAMIGIIAWDIASADVNVASVYPGTGTNWVMFIKNLGSNSITATAKIKVLFMRS